MIEQNDKPLYLPALVALIVGAIVGGGIFSLPQNMARAAGAGPMLIAWAITFVGMLALTRNFQWLSNRIPEIDDGLYGYARHGFGEYFGFNAAWGYWISVLVGNAGFLILMFSALGSFPMFGLFGNGNTLPALICELAILWAMHFMVLQGVRTAAMMNTLVTVAKIVPILLFIVCVALAFKGPVFFHSFWGTPALGDVVTQVKSTMLFTVWVFLGIESAAMYASSANSMQDVSRATLLGFAITVALLVCVSVLSLGILPQEELAKLQNPSMAGVITHILGPEAGALIDVGLIVSVGGALLAWTMLGGEMLYLAGQGDDNTIPSRFGEVNDAGAPASAMWLTNGAVSVVLITSYFNQSGYIELAELATSMALIPYLLSAGFGLKVSAQTEHKSTVHQFWTLIAVFYSGWLIYAAGMKYLLLSMVLYAPGLLLFAQAKNARGDQIFDHPGEMGYALVVLVFGILAAALIFTGVLTL
jgi:arginine:ornithine antiporter/lysine permease